jgi:spore germination cell wall hydrolase CwlJ-like protein
MIIDAAIFCLALNIFHEARGEPEPGRIEVALVTLNRAQASGQTVCQVVKAPFQFSWTQTKSMSVPRYEPKIWIRSLDEASRVHRYLHPMDTRNSLFFHTKDISPKWAKYKKRTIVIGNLIFYTNRNS